MSAKVLHNGGFSGTVHDHRPEEGNRKVAKSDRTLRFLQLESQFPGRFADEVERLLDVGDAISCVYFIQVDPDGPIKIGIADSVISRLGNLQSACPYDLRVRTFWRGPRLVERFLHRELAAHRIRGEWFRPEPFVLDVLSFVDQLPVLERCAA